MAFSALIVACTLALASATSSSSNPSTSSSSVSSSISSPSVSASNAYPSLQSLLAANPPSEQVVTLPASQPLNAAATSAYAQQLSNLGPDQQELVVQHPNPRRILVRVVKPIIFEERIVIVPYRRVTHEVRPVIEERHTVIYGKDGKQISGPSTFSKDLPGLDKPGSYASASGHLTRTIEKPVYTEPIIRKMGFSKRSNFDLSNLRPSTTTLTGPAPDSSRYSKRA
ncbi:hypothetical protein RDWZM_005505 [Blomia tropicalis]|uniref:Uncharacterized protein n=1 Tax=Blomia tropicalis TaxID=40697 RepID=A0A9Q0M456_BLOTA|nr:hypothetical protein BLOT_006093 [Blomia tropicalis]KAJ6219693.1 hypothetical protein RDWZM_005505 [Blomia tropicalis]